MYSYLDLLSLFSVTRARSYAWFVASLLLNFGMGLIVPPYEEVVCVESIYLDSCIQPNGLWQLLVFSAFRRLPRTCSQTRERQEKHYPTSRPGDGPFPASLTKVLWGALASPPPLPPRPSPPRSLLPLPPLPPPSRGGIVTICPTSALRRRNSTALVAFRHRRARPFWAPWVLPPTEIAHVFPQFLDLALPGRAVHEQVVTGLPLILAAPPAFVGRQLVDFIAQVVASPCAP